MFFLTVDIYLDNEFTHLLLFLMVIFYVIFYFILFFMSYFKINFEINISFLENGNYKSVSSVFTSGFMELFLISHQQVSEKGTLTNISNHTSSITSSIFYFQFIFFSTSNLNKLWVSHFFLPLKRSILYGTQTLNVNSVYFHVDYE